MTARCRQNLRLDFFAVASGMARQPAHRANRLREAQTATLIRRLAAESYSGPNVGETRRLGSCRVERTRVVDREFFLELRARSIVFEDLIFGWLVFKLGLMAGQHDSSFDDLSHSVAHSIPRKLE